MANRKSESASHRPIARIRSLEDAYYRVASATGWFVSGLQVCAVVIGLVSKSDKTVDTWQPAALAGVALLSALVRFASDRASGKADSLKRRREMMDGFGRAIPARELADIVDDAPALVRFLAERNEFSDDYFASKLLPSAMRTIHNTYESSWWTARLAQDMVFLEAAKALVVVSAAVILLRAALTPPMTGVQADFIRLASAGLLFVLTKGPLKRSLDYKSLSDGAMRVAQKCERAIQGDASEMAAVEILMEYQLVRKSSPLIPRTLWKLRRNSLNALWSSVDGEIARA
jgi:hypothetical protein